MWLLIAFIAVPMIEIALFIQVGGMIGLGWTLAIVLITAVLGTWLVRTQGMMALGQLSNSFSNVREPTEPLVHGAMILFAGALLLTPGFFTDAVGFLLLIPSVRQSAFRAIRARVNIHSFSSSTKTGGSRKTETYRRGTTRHDDVIDVEFHEIDENDDKTPGSSGWTRH